MEEGIPKFDTTPEVSQEIVTYTLLTYAYQHGGLEEDPKNGTTFLDAILSQSNGTDFFGRFETDPEFRPGYLEYNI